jgi:O-antigen/teichoic acid export membrane protein
MIGLVGGTLLIILSPFIISFLNLNSVWSVVFLSLLFLLIGLTIVNNGGLSGTLSFGFLAINGIAGTATRLIVSVTLVFLNFRLAGAFSGSAIGSLIAFLLSVLELKTIFKGVALTKDKISPSVLKTTFFPTLFASLAITLFLTVDVILARHFFSESVSGEFAAVAVLGKIIYYALGPVISVMFPLISARAANGTSYILPLLGSLAMVFGVGSLIGFVFFMFPVFILNILFGGRYLNAAFYLGPYCLFMTIFSINSVLTHFLLSVSYFRPMGLLFSLSVFAGILMILFHGSIGQLIWINVSVSFLYFVVVSTLVCRHINFPLLFLPTVKQKPLSAT